MTSWDRRSPRAAPGESPAGQTAREGRETAELPGVRNPGEGNGRKGKGAKAVSQGQSDRQTDRLKYREIHGGVLVKAPGKAQVI